MENTTDTTTPQTATTPGSTYVELKMRFSNRQAMLAFCEWMSDGGGENDFMMSNEESDDPQPIERLQYHPEDDRFQMNDPQRYGGFMADNLIIVHSGTHQ